MVTEGKNDPVVYDKAKYHLETTDGYGLPEAHASHHTLFFFRWLVDHDMMSEEFMSESTPLQEYQSGKRSILSLYEWWDCCLVDDMLSEQGNGFAQDYFDFEKGSYLRDYATTLQGDLPSEYHVQFSEENYTKIKKMIDNRFAKWKTPKPSRRWWWPL